MHYLTALLSEPLLTHFCSQGAIGTGLSVAAIECTFVFFLSFCLLKADILFGNQSPAVGEVCTVIKKYLIMPIALAAAGGIPYIAVNDDFSTQVQQAYDGITANEEDTSLGDLSATSSINPDVTDLLNPTQFKQTFTDNSDATLPAPRDSISQPFANSPLHRSLFDVFRFDITPSWVQSQWPRVSTGWLEDGYEGYRVPLVTGTTAQDLHGALTYFFDHRQRLQRIRFVGFTGDVRPLSKLVCNHHGFKPHDSANAALLTRSFNGRQTGALRFVHASVINASNARQQYEVALEINSTAGPFLLSDGVKSLLQSEKLSGRW